jgi:hypothetical protein
MKARLAQQVERVMVCEMYGASQPHGGAPAFVLR